MNECNARQYQYWNFMVCTKYSFFNLPSYIVKSTQLAKFNKLKEIPLGETKKKFRRGIFL